MRGNQRGQEMNKAKDLAGMFGGQKPLADAIGVDRSMVSHWINGRGAAPAGVIPSHYNHAIMEAARARDLDMARVSAVLDNHACPCCGARLEPGQQVTVHPKRRA